MPWPAVAGEQLAAQLEQDALVSRGHRYSSPRRKRVKRRTTMFSPVLADASLTRSPTVTLSSLMNGCSSRQISAKNFFEPALHDLLDDRRRLLLAFQLRGEDLALLRDAVGRHVLAPHELGAGRRHLHGEIAHQRLELRRACHEVGLAVDLDQHAHAAARMNVRLHQPLAGSAARARLGLRDAALAQRVDGGVEVAGGLDQRLLALHHAGAGPFAKLFHLVGGDCHSRPLPCCNARPRRAARTGERWSTFTNSDGRGTGLALVLGALAAEGHRLLLRRLRAPSSGPRSWCPTRSG